MTGDLTLVDICRSAKLRLAVDRLAYFGHWITPTDRPKRTHTHMDHSPAAALLKAQTGAELLGMQPAHPERQDQSFTPDRTLRHGYRLSIVGCTLRVIHTPGHTKIQRMWSF